MTPAPLRGAGLGSRRGCLGLGFGSGSGFSIRMTRGPDIFAFVGASNFRPAGFTGSSKFSSFGVLLFIALSFFVVFFFVFFLARCFAFVTLTFSAVSTAEAEDATPSSLNHSIIVASRPADTVDMCPVISGMPSMVHFSMMSLEPTPIFFAIWCTRVFTAFLATCVLRH